jgi:hypothetical protein
MTTMTESTLREMGRTARAAALGNGLIVLAGVVLAVLAFELAAPVPVYVIPAAALVYGLYRAWRGLSLWSATNDALAPRAPSAVRRVIATRGNGHGPRPAATTARAFSERVRTAMPTATRTATRVSRFCGACGAPRVVETDRFCRRCGETLDA